MNIKLDENMPFRLAGILTHLGHQTDTVPQEGLARHDDNDVWEAAQTSGRFLITQDLDFSDVRRFIPGTHHGLLLVRLRDPGREALTQKVQTVFQNEDVESWKGCFVVATERKIRIRRPKEPSDKI
jgi:predicted nuclease of predicted toxin-antitoxin system